MKSQTFADRLNTALNLRDMTAAELSRATNINEGTISCYRKGLYEAKQNRIYLIAKALRVNETWLMGYDAPIEPQNEEDKPKKPIPRGFEPLPKMVKKPLIGDIACGNPITAEQNIADYVDVPEDVHCDFCLRCRGDSMIDAGIQDGDVVYIRIQPEVEDGQIAAVRIGDEATLKCVYWDEQKQVLTLVPANRAYRPRTYTGPELEEIQIEGLAVGFTHWF